MRKIIAVLALLMMCGQAWAGLIPLASGSVALADLRLSAVDGTAFIDLGAAINVAQYAATGDVLFTITNSAGKKLTGYIKAAGTGETYSEKISASDDRTFDSDTGWWKKQTGVTITGGLCRFTAVAGSEGLYKAGAGVVEKALYKSSMDVLARTSGSVRIFYGATNAGTSRSTVATFTEYRTASSGDYIQFLTNTAPGTFDIDNLSFKRVLTPSETGVTITSTRGGSTYNWTSQESGFNYNDASGYTYTVYREIPYTMQNPTYQMPRSGAMSKTELMGAAGAFTDSTLWLRRPGTNGTVANIPQDGTVVLTGLTNNLGFQRDNVTTFVIGKKYRISCMVNSYTSGTIRIGIGGSDGALISSAGAFSADVTSTVAVNPNVYIIGTASTFTGTLSNLTIREILP